MWVAVIGGRLQGLEAAYLAKKAGMHVLLIDKNEDIPALKIADNFICMDAGSKEKLVSVIKNVDLIFPALENGRVLHSLAATAEFLKIPFAFDLKAYQISASKRRSDLLFADIGIPAPGYFPDCAFPLIAKPSEASGSEGVVCLGNESDLKKFRHSLKDKVSEWVIQEYLEGPSYSIEVLGYRGHYLPIQVTDLEMDALYDCKRVLAPSGLSTSLRKKFAEIAVKIAAEISLNGIMDVEVILHNDQLKVLEIDARLPSQTPTAVYHSSGVNMLELMAEAFINGRLPEPEEITEKKFAIFEHISISPGRLEISGEHVVASAGPLDHLEEFFGADEALTNYRSGRDNWMATLIIIEANREEAFIKRSGVIRQICSKHSIDTYLDPVPPDRGFRSMEGAGS
ncbi:MAG: 3-methylornithine--L-lysine ligase PylC [Dethiobacteria bacterium]